MQHLPREVYADILSRLPLNQVPWDRRSYDVLKDPIVVVRRYIRRTGYPCLSIYPARSLSWHLNLDHPSAYGAVSLLARSDDFGDEIFLKCQREERQGLVEAMVNGYAYFNGPPMTALDAGTPSGRRIVQDIFKRTGSSPYTRTYLDSYFGRVCRKRWEQAALACLDMETPPQSFASEAYIGALRSGYVSVLDRVRSVFPDDAFPSETIKGALRNRLGWGPIGSFSMFLYLFNRTDFEMFNLHQWRDLDQIMSFLTERDIPVPEIIA